MSKYTLTYFEARGRAEISRLIFAAAGQEVSVEKRRIIISDVEIVESVNSLKDRWDALGVHS